MKKLLFEPLITVAMLLMVVISFCAVPQPAFAGGCVQCHEGHDAQVSRVNGFTVAAVIQAPQTMGELAGVVPVFGDLALLNGAGLIDSAVAFETVSLNPFMKTPGNYLTHIGKTAENLKNDRSTLFYSTLTRLPDH